MTHSQSVAIRGVARPSQAIPRNVSKTSELAMPDRPEPGSETGAATPTRRVTGLRVWIGGFEHAPRRPAAIAPQTINPTKRAARSETRSCGAGNRLWCEAPADKAVRVSYCFSAGGPSTPGLLALVFPRAGHIDNPRTHRGDYCLRGFFHNLNLHEYHSTETESLLRVVAPTAVSPRRHPPARVERFPSSSQSSCC